MALKDDIKSLTAGRASPSAQELLAQEGRPVPTAFLEERPRFLGDEDIKALDGLETELDENDIVSIVPAIAGGIA